MSDADGRYRVLDVHHHVGSAFLALGGPIDATRSTASAATPSPADRELASRLEIMDGAGVDQAIVIPGHGYLRPRGIPDTMAENDLIARYRDRLPSRFPAAVGIVELAYGDAEPRRARPLQARARPPRASASTPASRASPSIAASSSPTSRRWRPRNATVIHAMNEDPEEALEARGPAPDPRCRRHPRLDAFGSYEATREVLFIAEVAPNICFDTSLSYNFDFIEDFARQFGAERVVFGTDLYSHPVGKRISHLLPQIKALHFLDSEDGDPVGNARRLFGVA